MMPIISGLAEDKEVTNTLTNTGTPFALANADSESHPIIMSVDGDKLIVTSDGSPVSTGLGNVLPSVFSDYKTGPFNTYYVAINLASGDNSDDVGETRLSKEKGEIAYILNTDNLHQTAKGYTFDPTLYNVMLIIPPVYWYSEMDAPTEENPTPTTGKLYMASSPDAFVSMGITADKLKDYAHTYTDRTDTENPIVGHAPAIAIGVYEAYNDNGVLTSQSGRTPTGDNTLRNFSTLSIAGNTDNTYGTYQLWNYYQWTLYRIMGFTIMGNMDSQYMMGDGPISSSASIVTGQTDSAIQKSPTSSDSVCLLIENSWGARGEWIGDVMVSSGRYNVGNTLGGSTSVTNVVNTLAETVTGASSSGRYDTFNPVSDVFGTASTLQPTASPAGQGINDSYTYTGGSNRAVAVGGTNNEGEGGAGSGLSCVYVDYSWNINVPVFGSRLAYVITDNQYSAPNGANDDYAYIMSYDTHGTVSNVQSIENGVSRSYMPTGTTLNSYWNFVPYAELPPFSDATDSVDLAVGSDSVLQFYNSGHVVLQTASGTVDLGRVNDVTPTPVTVTVQNGVMTYTKADSTVGTANVLLYKANEGDYVYGQNVKLLNDLSQGNVYVGQYQYGVTTANSTKDIGAIGTFTSQTETEGEGEDAIEVTTVVPNVALFNTANVSTSTVTSSITQGQDYATINSVSIATEFSDSDSVDYTVTGFYAPKTQTYVTIETGGGLAYDILLYLPILILISVITFIGYATLRPDSEFIRSLKSRF